MGFAVACGWGPYKNHPHLHMSIAAPPEASDEQFTKMIEEALKGTYWLDRQNKIEKYRDRGWMEYMNTKSKHHWIVELTRTLTQKTA